ncbi:NAD-dependent epimerase/dehydratase family protein [Kitasatospora sp. NBC_01287]|uniref:NAD-dependent epimerase/dehydratase family protein n=1 Tax=Kitasatospora sp. NBC_01287 TaxID=2903573 RepID=UPI002252D148|nr:NAD-dependent epimerase/dehydratase family protein [Kitasatospora sp. NBC_01287]MCX4745452.1 NAD-dependent epimerase/dehydratase family protein [Kitasatospora sp. NBC_01287]
MRQVLIIGVTGTVGHPPARQLIERGDRVRALVRDPDRTGRVLPAGVLAVVGDVTDAASVRAAVAGCDTVFHTAGLPEQWLRDKAQFHRVNVTGTGHLVDAALAEGVACFVHTSTMDVFERPQDGAFDESVLAHAPLGTAYERSKQEADRLVTEAVATRGLPARITHPAAVFGPGPTRATALNRMLVDLARGRVPMLPPGGMAVVFNEDLARGHLLAAEAPIGSRYLFADRYLELPALAELVRSVRPGARVPLTLAAPAAWVFAAVGELTARVTGSAPQLSFGELHFLSSEVTPDAALARRELGWTATEPATAVTATLQHFKALTAASRDS